ncbi:hypothetical protein KGQ71_00210 [Patescibacteria group bacterium]|nr:hypothetical protein [Patescibacteria group bacterium]
MNPPENEPIGQINNLNLDIYPNKNRIFWTRFFIIGAVVVILLSIPLIWIYTLYPTTNPFKTLLYLNYHRTHPHQNLTARTIGFAPSWQADKLQNVRLDLLTDVIYFSLTVDDQGHFARKDAKGEDDAGWVGWNQAPANDLLAKAQIMGDRTGFTVSLLDNDQITGFLSSESKQNNLIDDAVTAVKRKHLKEVNLDFEYTGEPPDLLPNEFTTFVRRMRTQLDAAVPGTELDMNLLARSGRDPALFDIPNLVPLVDRFIVMSYDYYTPGSDSAGPVAPMNGHATQRYFFDVTTTYSDLLKLIPAKQIIMGVPYYGYDWPVEDKTDPRSLALPQSDANGYVETLSYGRARQTATFSGGNCHFDDLAQEPWCGYTDPKTGKDRVAWFENNQSIQVKYAFAKDQKLAGVGIWALGYDKDYPDLWNILKKTFVR